MTTIHEDWKPTEAEPLPPPGDLDVEAELARFESAERERLGLDQGREQWHDANPDALTKEQSQNTTLLVSGLTHAHDTFIRAAVASTGYTVKTLECPDNNALRFGKEFGNRGQCNPTYFTVGNLVKYLTHLRDDLGMSTQEIVDGNVFLTAGACGPCRFGMYVTEYRKALRDSGFDGFRVVLVSQTGGVHAASGDGLQSLVKQGHRVFMGIMLGDVLNALMYRIRPYEVEEGATDRAIAECKEVIADALARRRSTLRATWRCRKILSAVEVDRTQVKPRVGIIGEFWAMTTEGDGNYRLQRFLESEGAEVDVQLTTAWILFLIWEGRWDTQKRMELRGADDARKGLSGVNIAKRRFKLWAGDRLMRLTFQAYAKLMGLEDYHLPDLDELAQIAHRFYDNHLRGGEGHMEVGKLIQNVVHNKVNMTLSVKPFGCMPSAGVSDGIQTLITEMYPEAIYLPIETSGDAAVNVYSRVQMQLFKAKQAAAAEVEEALAATGLTADEVKDHIAKSRRLSRSTHRSPHRAGCTAADLIYEVAGKTGRV